MGVSDLRIVGMVLTQAFAVGLIGYCLGVGLAALFGEVVPQLQPAGVLHAVASAGGNRRRRRRHCRSVEPIEHR